MVLKTIRRIEGRTEFTNIFAAFNLSPVKESLLKSSYMFSKVARARMNKTVHITEYLSVSLQKRY